MLQAPKDERKMLNAVPSKTHHTQSVWKAYGVISELEDERAGVPLSLLAPPRHT